MPSTCKHCQRPGTPLDLASLTSHLARLQHVSGPAHQRLYHATHHAITPAPCFLPYTCVSMPLPHVHSCTSSATPATDTSHMRPTPSSQHQPATLAHHAYMASLLTHRLKLTMLPTYWQPCFLTLHLAIKAHEKHEEGAGNSWEEAWQNL